MVVGLFCLQWQSYQVTREEKNVGEAIRLANAKSVGTDQNHFGNHREQSVAP